MSTLIGILCPFYCHCVVVPLKWCRKPDPLELTIRHLKTRNHAHKHIFRWLEFRTRLLSFIFQEYSRWVLFTKTVITDRRTSLVMLLVVVLPRDCVSHVILWWLTSCCLDPALNSISCRVCTHSVQRYVQISVFARVVVSKTLSLLQGNLAGLTW